MPTVCSALGACITIWAIAQAKGLPVSHASPFTAAPEQWLRYMPAAQHQRQELRLVENAWDHLSLLSSLSLLSAKASSGADLAQARRDFAALSADLLRGLAGEALKNRIADIAARAQVCIDVLVRNLFERTADIGFFATDVGVAAFLGDPSPETRPAIEARLREYADKYTVYGNIFLFDTAGRPCAQLQAVEPLTPAPQAEADRAFLQAVLQSHAPYAEHYAVHGFSGEAGKTLMYARRVDFEGQPVGVLCLQFKLADEMPAIFDSVQDGGALPGQGGDAVLALVDAEGRVLVSSDPLQLPSGWKLPQAAAAGVQPVSHASRRYLMAVRDTQGFQGYAGPGWRGVALLPLDVAFDEAAQDPAEAFPVELAGHADVLSQELRDIPGRSAAIQSALERSVWNGLLDLHQLGGDAAVPRELQFAKTLLSEIGATARKTALAFAGALQDLYGVVMRSLLSDARGRASLAMQILDRNLYERANDCRWWALTPQFARTLEAGTRGCGQATAVLQEINRLYTVYASLVLFDREGRVVAVSRPDQAEHVGAQLDEEWVGRCLRLQGSQGYVVSRYGPSRFYGQGPTFVYAAAVRGDGRTAGHTEARTGAGSRSAAGPLLGGIAIVWDAAEQLSSILADCAVGAGPQDVLAFVDAQGAVVCAAGDAVVAALPELAAGHAESRMAVLGPHLYALGFARGQGYREFRAQDGYDHGLGCTVLRHVCQHHAAVPLAPALSTQPGVRADAAHGVQLASFRMGAQWFGLESASVVEAAPDVTVLHAGGLRAPFLGLAQIGQRVCPVVDLRSLIAPTEGGAPVPAPRGGDPNRQIVVVRATLDDGRVQEFALRVDALGAILELDRRTLQPVSVGTAAGAPALVDAVVPVATAATASQSPGRAMLCRISPQWLQQCAAGALVDAPPQELQALLAAAA
ncbi:Chemotaxis signal transduction protein [Paracidovorax valerianellae]|uniref:Chemotaxis signal transduction protein n=1 Tax=Paracidovorax valerianellae TaxID=187868 RepID=A0A1G6NXU2_9BURK|nr:Chemotaxis signal transduction protein [Paracidovorax valerianellae]